MTGGDTGLIKLRNSCVGIGYVGREIGSIIIAVKCFASSVSPCAVKAIICSNKLQCGSGFDGC